MHHIAWKQVASFVEESLPSWCNSPGHRQRETGSAGSSTTVAGSFLGFDYMSPKGSDSGADADTDNSSTLSAKLNPWLEAKLADLHGGMRRPESELIVGFFN